MRYRHFCKKCGLTWFDAQEKSNDCDCPKKTKLIRVELPKPRITHYGTKGAFQAMIDALEKD